MKLNKFVSIMSLISMVCLCSGRPIVSKARTTKKVTTMLSKVNEMATVTTILQRVRVQESVNKATKYTRYQENKDVYSKKVLNKDVV